MSEFTYKYYLLINSRPERYFRVGQNNVSYQLLTPDLKWKDERVVRHIYDEHEEDYIEITTLALLENMDLYEEVK